MTLKEIQPGEQVIRVITGVIDSVDLKKPKNSRDNGLTYPVKIKEDNPNLRHPNTYDAPEGVAKVLSGMIGRTVAIDLKVDRVKDDKEDDGHPGSYWWSVKGVHRPEAGAAPDDAPPARQKQQEQQTGKTPAPKSKTQKDVNPWPSAEGPVQGLMEKMAGEWFFGMMSQEALEMKTEADVCLELRQLRHYLYWNLKERAIEPREYCFDHDTPFLYSSKSEAWGHPLQGREICYRDGEEPEDVEEPEPAEEPDWEDLGTPELPF